MRDASLMFLPLNVKDTPFLLMAGISVYLLLISVASQDCWTGVITFEDHGFDLRQSTTHTWECVGLQAKPEPGPQDARRDPWGAWWVSSQRLPAPHGDSQVPISSPALPLQLSPGVCLVFLGSHDAKGPNGTGVFPQTHFSLGSPNQIIVSPARAAREGCGLKGQWSWGRGGRNRRQAWLLDCDQAAS